MWISKQQYFHHDASLSSEFMMASLPICISGKNLCDAHEKLKEFEIVVTFNGKQFDIPL